MAGTKSVLLIGLDPALIDFSSAEYAAFPGLNAALVLSAIAAAEERLKGLGYDVQSCMTDAGETAEAVVRDRLRQKRYDCVMIGAGVRVPPSRVMLFEKLVNAAHELAPQAKLCFNTKPSDTAEAVQRWL